MSANENTISEKTSPADRKAAAKTAAGKPIHCVCVTKHYDADNNLVQVGTERTFVGAVPDHYAAV
ncbi:MAG: hypothetical protein LUG50_09850 [Planctomycetaceae bacterium]|nr:hypothetical protein [Planctomycetaceae bacterium]